MTGTVRGNGTRQARRYQLTIINLNGSRGQARLGGGRRGRQTGGQLSINAHNKGCRGATGDGGQGQGQGKGLPAAQRDQRQADGQTALPGAGRDGRDGRLLCLCRRGRRLDCNHCYFKRRGNATPTPPLAAHASMHMHLRCTRTHHAPPPALSASRARRGVARGVAPATEVRCPAPLRRGRLGPPRPRWPKETVAELRQGRQGLGDRQPAAASAADTNLPCLTLFAG